MRKSYYELVDSGFRGTVGVLLDEAIEEKYGRRLRGSGRLGIRLVCAKDGWYGEQIMNLNEEEIPQLQRGFAPVLANPENRVGLHGNTYELAIAMQTLPRYHGAYARLVSPSNAREMGLIGENENRVIARPVNTEIEQDIDGVDEEDGNASIVNPLAAAVVQFRVVQAALERSGQFA